MRFTIKGCALLCILLTTGCLVWTVDLYAPKLPPDQVDYFIKEYKYKSAVESRHAYYGIKWGASLSTSYEYAIELFRVREPSTHFINNMKMAQDAVYSHLNKHSEIWVAAGKSEEDIDLAFTIFLFELDRMGVNKKIEALKNMMKLRVSLLDREKYKNSYQVYATFTQLIELAKFPTGSLRSFESTVNSLKRDFTREMALAEFEFQK